jgi:hypothetical protein
MWCSFNFFYCDRKYEYLGLVDPAYWTAWYGASVGETVGEGGGREGATVSSGH